MGIAAHGIGTARALQMSEKAGAFGGLAIGLTGLFTAIGVPLIMGLLR
jgi:putative effector of murein hydrolase